MIAVGWPIGHMRMRRTVVRHTVVTSYAGRHRIWVFGLWLPLDPILLCVRYISYWLGLFRSLHSLYRALDAGFLESRWFYDRLLEIMAGHHVSFWFIVFPDMLPFGDIYLRASH